MWICLFLIADLFLLHVFWNSIFRCIKYLGLLFALDKFDPLTIMKLLSLSLMMVFALKFTLIIIRILSLFFTSVAIVCISWNYSVQPIYVFILKVCFHKRHIIRTSPPSHPHTCQSNLHLLNVNVQTIYM